MKKISLFALALAAICGCHAGAQVPPTVHTLTITVSNAPCPAGTPASSCGYVFSEAIVSGSTCPSVTGTAYTPVNQSNPVAQPATGDATFVDNNAAGKSICAIGQTIQGGAVSPASTAIGPFVVPANPTAPALGNGVVAEAKPALQPTEPQMAKMELSAVVR